MSYRKLNQVTRPFTVSIPLCDDALQDIDTEAKYFISVYMDSGHWQVVSEEEDCERLEFFTPYRKRQWKVFPMGDLNADPTFVEIIIKLQMEWNTLSK